MSYQIFCSYLLSPCYPINDSVGKAGSREIEKERNGISPSLLDVVLIWDGCMLLLQIMSGCWNVVIDIVGGNVTIGKVGRKVFNLKKFMSCCKKYQMQVYSISHPLLSDYLKLI